jgi:hypothetical protein
MPSPATQKNKREKKHKQNTLQLSKKITTPAHLIPDPSLQKTSVRHSSSSSSSSSRSYF